MKEGKNWRKSLSFSRFRAASSPHGRFAARYFGNHEGGIHSSMVFWADFHPRKLSNSSCIYFRPQASMQCHTYPLSLLRISKSCFHNATVLSGEEAHEHTPAPGGDGTIDGWVPENMFQIPCSILKRGRNFQLWAIQKDTTSQKSSPTNFIFESAFPINNPT